MKKWNEEMCERRCEEASSCFRKYFDMYERWRWLHVVCWINFLRQGFGLHCMGWRFKAIHDSYKYCAPENAPSRARPGHPRLLEAELRRKVDEGSGKRGPFSTLACTLASMRIQWLHCGFRVHCASGTMGIVALFRGPEIHTFSQARFSTMSAFYWAKEDGTKNQRINKSAM